MARIASACLILSAAMLNTDAFGQGAGPLVLPGAVPPSVEAPDRPAPAAPRPQRTGESPAAPASPAAANPASPAPAPAHHGPAGSAAQPTAALSAKVFGQTFSHAGKPATEGGELEIVERQPGVVGLRLKTAGRMISNPADACVIDMGGGEPAPMLPIEEPYRKSRYRLQSAVCPLVVEVLEHSVRVSIPDGECSFVQADCRLNPEGLWGPPGADLVGNTQSIERRRGRAERELREVSRKLLRRLSGDEQREAAAEQAAFSSERTMVCRNYADEDRHGFCAAELTAARVEGLKKRYELTPERQPRNR